MRRSSFCVMMRFIRREAKKEFGDEIPKQVWAAAQRPHSRSAQARIAAEPKATIAIPFMKLKAGTN